MKVLPRERKRHTARCISSAHTAAQSQLEGGIPPSSPDGGTPSNPDEGYPHPDPTKGVPPSSPDGGTSAQS